MVGRPGDCIVCLVASMYPLLFIILQLERLLRRDVDLLRYWKWICLSFSD